MKRRRKRRKRKSAGKTTHHHQQRAAGRHTSTHLIYYYYDSLIKLGDACDCERVSRQAGRQGENPRRKSPRESPDCPPHARQKSNLDASLVEPRLFQSFCLCDAGLLSVGWLPLGNEPRSPDPRARRRRLIPRFSSCVCSGSWRGDFSSALSLSLSLSPSLSVDCAVRVCLDWDGGVARFATTTSTAPLFYCLRTGICFRLVAVVAISANRLLGLTLPFVSPLLPAPNPPPSPAARVRPPIQAVQPPIPPRNRVLGLGP